MIAFLPGNHAVHRIGPTAIAALESAQQNVVLRAFPNAKVFCERILSDLRLVFPSPDELADQPVTAISDLPAVDLSAFWHQLAADAGIPEASTGPLASSLTQRSQLVRAFEHPDAVLEWATEKVIEITADFPRALADLEVGRNPGDVIDPYILAANQALLYGGDLQQAVGATVAHKALMILEGLMGHLHEEVVGRMRGNVKLVEPRGENQEMYDPDLNPFPGADVVQPPTAPGEALRIHQVKSKTGTLNASGGARLAEQMRQLRMRYRGAEIYSHSLVGNTLRGHRTMGTMRRAEPDLIITVGATAFQILTRSQNGAELLLSLYRDAFRLAAERTGYNIEVMAAGITAAFRAQADEAGEAFLEAMLHRVTQGSIQEQDSRHWIGGRRRAAD